jgi:hypothetical protein
MLTDSAQSLSFQQREGVSPTPSLSEPIDHIDNHLRVSFACLVWIQENICIAEDESPTISRDKRAEVEVQSRGYAH